MNKLLLLVILIMAGCGEQREQNYPVTIDSKIWEEYDKKGCIFSILKAPAEFSVEGYDDVYFMGFACKSEKIESKEE